MKFYNFHGVGVKVHASCAVLNEMNADFSHLITSRGHICIAVKEVSTAPRIPAEAIVSHLSACVLYRSEDRLYLVSEAGSLVTHDNRITLHCTDPTAFYPFIHDAVVGLVSTELMRANTFPVHASGVALDDEWGIAFAGAGSSGKSTILSFMIDEGFSMLGDDTLFLRHADNGFQVLGLPSRVSLRDRDMEDHRYNPTRRRLMIDIAHCPISVGPVTLIALAFPCLWVSPSTRLRKAATELALRRTTAHLGDIPYFGFLGSLGKDTRIQASTVMQLVCDVPVYEMFLGTDRRGVVQAVKRIIEMVAPRR